MFRIEDATMDILIGVILLVIIGKVTILCFIILYSWAKCGNWKQQSLL